MQIPLSELPEDTKERLVALQANPLEYDCYFKRFGRGGSGTALVVCILCLLGGAGAVQGEYVPMYFIVPVAILLTVGALAAWNRFRRHGRARIKPMLMINPLYIMRVTLDDVKYHNLLTEVERVNITHHHTNGAYTYTAFQFKFTGGQQENITVTPKARAEGLANQIDEYRRTMYEAIQRGEIEAVAAHDVLFELHDAVAPDPRERKAAISKRRLKLWGMGTALGSLIGVAAGGASYYTAQQKNMNYACYVGRYNTSPNSCIRYFDRWAFRFFEDDARQGIAALYKAYWKKHSKTATELRQLMRLEKVPHVTDKDRAEILKMYREGSKKALAKLYGEAIKHYESAATGADPRARKAIVRLLEYARDKHNYRVSLEYSRHTRKSDQPLKLSKKLGNKKPVPMESSFTDELNRTREGMISERIEKAFGKIIPKEILEFTVAGDSKAEPKYKSSYERTLARLRSSRRSRSSRLYLEGLPPKEEATKPPEISFHIKYTVFPTASVYTQRKVTSEAARKYYTGIGFDWDFDIRVGKEDVHEFRRVSYPPPSFSVSTYGSRYSRAQMSKATIYSRMAATAFDNFSQKIMRHFGVATAKANESHPGDDRRRTARTSARRGVDEDGNPIRRRGRPAVDEDGNPIRKRAGSTRRSRDIEERMRKLRERLKRSGKGI